MVVHLRGPFLLCGPIHPGRTASTSSSGYSASMEWLAVGALALFALLAVAHDAAIKTLAVVAWALMLLATLWEPAKWLLRQGRSLLALLA